MTANLHLPPSDSATNIGNKIMDSFAAAIGNIMINPPRPTPMMNKPVFVELNCQLFFRQLLWQRHISACSAVYQPVDGQ